jgi:hypothetical protein
MYILDLEDKSEGLTSDVNLLLHHPLSIGSPSGITTEKPNRLVFFL